MGPRSWMLSVFSPRNLQGPLVVCVESSGISMVGHLSDHRGYPRGGGGCTRKISVKICKPEIRRGPKKIEKMVWVGADFVKKHPSENLDAQISSTRVAKP